MKKTLINQIKTEMSGVLNNAQRQRLKEVLVLLLYFYWRFIKLKVFFSKFYQDIKSQENVAIFTGL